MISLLSMKSNQHGTMATRIKRGPRYKIVMGSSHASAADAAAQAQLKVKTTSGEPIGIAADGMCCLSLDGGKTTAEWDVYILMKY